MSAAPPNCGAGEVLGRGQAVSNSTHSLTPTNFTASCPGTGAASWRSF